MKTDRERLIEWIYESGQLGVFASYDHEIKMCERFADYLISKGGTIPVRCGECIHHGKYTATGNIYCKHPKGLTDHKEDCFCSYGEREENEID